MGRHAFTQKFLPLALAAAMALPAVPAMAATNDISGHWAEKVMAEWQEKGLLKGYNDGTLKPNNSITRAEFVTLLNNAKGITAEKSISFTDVTASDWFYDAVAKAAGYTKGYDDNTFRPNQTITRAEAAIMLANVAGLAANESGADGFTDAIPAWAKGSIGAVAAAGFMSGYPDGSFGASANITRAEAVSCLNRMLNGAEETEPSKDEDVVIEKAGTVLENETVAGNVTIAASVGEGNVTLKNVEIKGDLIVKGGGANSITLNATKIAGKVILQKENVHLHLIGDTKIPNVEMKAPARITMGSSFKGEIDTLTIALEKSSKKDIRIEAPVDRMTLESEASLILNANVNRLTVDADAKNSEIEIKDGATVNTLDADAKVTLTGTGKINQLNASASGITLDNSLSVKKTVTDTGVKEPTTTGGSSGGGGSKTPTTPTVNVAAIGTVEGIEVATGTLNTEDAAIAALPKQVVLLDNNSNPIKDNGENVLADVEWKSMGYTIKSGTNYTKTPTGFKGTLEGNETQCANTFIGKVTIPSGYTFTGNANALTIITTITVKKADYVTLKKIDAAAIADIAKNLESYVSEGKVVEELTKQKLLPTKLSLYCGTQFVTTVNIPENTNWTAEKSTTSGKESYEQYNLTPTISWDSIKVPAGYQLKTKPNGDVDLSANCSVYVKKLDDSKLQAAIKTAEETTKDVLLWATSNGYDGVTDPDKIYVISDDSLNGSKLDAETIKSEITKGVKFVVDNDDMYSAFGTKLFEAKGKTDFDNQAACDTLTKELETATTTLETLLKTATTGTKVNDAYVVELVKDWLDGRGNSPWNEGVVLTPNGNKYSLPKSDTLYANDVADMKEDIAFTLSWTFDTTYLEEDQDGALALTNQTPTKPTDVSLTATLTEYSVDGGTAVSVTNGKVGDYTATIAAPLKLRADTNNSAALTSGVDGTATIVVPTNGLVTINKNATTPIEVAEVVTLGESGLLNVPTLNQDKTDSDANGIALTINATPNQLPAVLASDSTTDCETATVKFTIPANALTLTDAGKKVGWYIPNDGLTLTADVKVWHPLIKITKVKLDNNENNVTVKFNAEHWVSKDIKFVYMALVPSADTQVSDSKPQGNTGVTGVEGADTLYCDISIPASNLTAETEYAVWVKIGDGAWVNSNKTYTHPASSTE